MLCQVCGVSNRDDSEYCRRCHNKLLVISGGLSAEELESFEAAPEEQFSLDEHLLERISILEEVVRRTTDSLRQTLGALYKLEQKILVNQTGITTLRDLLESKRLVAREEWSELWETRMDYQLLALEKRERFAAVKGNISALYRGDAHEDFGRHLLAAEHSLLSFDISSGVQALEKAHGLDSRNHELSFFLAETFFNEGDTERALHYFEKVLATKPDHFESLVYCGVLHHEHGDSERAEELLSRAAELFPESFLPAFSLGAVCASRGELQRAVDFLEQAVTVDPIPQAYFLLGSCYYEMGRPGAAIRRLEESLRLDPTATGAHHLLALAYLDRRWHRKAHDVLQQGHRLAPNRLRYDELVSLASPESSRFEALQEPTTEILRQAEALLARGSRREALTTYRRAVALEPENPPLLVLYAMACLELGRVQEIEGLIHKVVDAELDERWQVGAYVTLIESLRSQGKYGEGNRVAGLMLQEAASDFAQAMARAEMAWNAAEMDDTVRGATAKDGTAHQDDADLDSALDNAQRAVEVSPPEILYLCLAAKGWVHYRRGEFDLSVDCLRRASDLGGKARTLLQLGMALLAGGQRDAAKEALLAVRKLIPEGLVIEEKVLEVLKDGARLLQDPPI